MKMFLSACLVVGLLGGMGLGLAHRASSKENLPTDTAKLPKRVAANGRIEGGREELELRPEVPGTLAQVAVRENQNVARGELLAELDNRVQKAELKQAQASVAVARVSAQQAEVELQRIRRAGAGASAEQRDAGHFKSLLALAQLQEAEAKMGRAEAELAKTQLHAPWDGRVLRIYTEPGALVGPLSPTPMLRFADLSKRRVRAFVEELDAFQIRPGQRATVTLDGLPNREFAGHVAMLLPMMSKESPQSGAPDEYRDIYFRQVVIELQDADELPLNLRVRTWIEVSARE